MSERKLPGDSRMGGHDGREWRGMQEFERDAALLDEQQREFPAGVDTPPAGLSRRRFMGLMGASAALAGTGLAGCVRKPQQRIVPYTTRPEDRIPGSPEYFRSAMAVGPRVLGVQVESQDGRPTKVEGNPDHPMSFGASDAWAQAAVDLGSAWARQVLLRRPCRLGDGASAA